MVRRPSKMREVQITAYAAVRAHFAIDDVHGRVLAAWVEGDGRVVLHLDSTETATVVTHALWRGHRVDGRRHPERGVLVWVP